MKKNYSIRKIDNLGRIVIPMDFRRALEISDWDELRISLENDTVTIRRATPHCTFCGAEGNDFTSLEGKHVCPQCLARLGIK